MKVVRWLLTGLAVVLLLAAGAVLAARHADGPVGPLPGGALVAGERVSGPVDWSFVEGVQEVELQLVEPPRSRTVWIVHHEGSAYIPCGLPGFRLWKRWPHEAVEDGRAVLRIGGKLYDGELVKVEDAELHGTIAGLLREKYGVTSDLDTDSLWVFRFER